MSVAGATAPDGVLRLSVPLTFTASSFEAIDPSLHVATEPERKVRTVHWDTSDLRLARWGTTLEHTTGEGWVLRLPPTAQGVAAEVGIELRLEGPGSTPPEKALLLVRGFTRHAPVEAVARLVTLRRALSMSDAGGTTLLNVEDSTVSVYSGPHITQRFREIELRPSTAAGRALASAVAAAIEAKGAQPSEPRQLVARALGMAGGPPPELSAPALGPQATAGDAVRRAIAASVIRLIAHGPGVRLGRHPEDVHQARVASRRLRSDLRTFRPLLEPEWTDSLRDELRWLGAELGRVRDAEVLRDRLRSSVGQLPPGDRRPGATVVAPLGAQVRAARRHLLAAMDAPRYTDLLDRLVDAARTPALAGAAAEPAEAALPGLMRRPWKSLRSGAEAIRPGAPDEQLHDLRIRAKRCRYAAEAASAAIGRRASVFAKEVAALQEVLGELHDAVVAEAWLRERARPRRLPDTATFAAGELAGLQRDAAQRAREAWPAVWRRARGRWNRAWG